MDDSTDDDSYHPRKHYAYDRQVSSSRWRTSREYIRGPGPETHTTESAQDGQDPPAGVYSYGYFSGSGNDPQVQGHFVPEIQKYNPYVIFKGEQLPVPIWELPEEKVQDFHDRYFIAKDKSRVEARKTLNRLLEGNINTIERGHGYKFNIPKYTDNMEFNEEVKVSLAKAGKTISRSFCNANQREVASRTGYTIDLIERTLGAGLNISKRTVLYTNKDLFGDQSKSDQAINDICALTNIRRGSLGIIAAEKGIVVGNIFLELTNGKSISCSIGVQIPHRLDQIKDVCVEIGSRNIEYILVVEKHTMLNYLLEMDYHTNNNCIILTGCGMPTLQTRDFLRFLKQRTGLPVFGLCDPDPEGISILATYARGSCNSAYDNFNISVPSICWVGLSSSDMIKLNLSETNYSRLSREDKTMLKNLWQDDLSDVWKRRIEEMISFDKKASFEAIHSLGFDYFATNLLPDMINKVREGYVQVYFSLL